MNSKRRGMFLIIFYVFFLILTAIPKNAEATIGMTPALVDINFEPGYKFLVNFNVLGVSPEQKIEIYTKGDFAEYATLSKNETIGRGGFTVYVTLPNEAKKVGKNFLFIGIMEKKDDKGGIGVRVGVEALIVIHVPYPGKYAEISLLGGNVNEGEPINFVVEINNLGTENFSASPLIEIYSGNEKIKTLTSENRLLQTKTKETFEIPLETKGMKPGIYNATALLDYEGGIAKAEQEFKIGGLFVNITNHTSTFKKGKINKFFINIESQWNSRIDYVYAAVNITNLTSSIDYFKTPSASIEPWNKVVLEGFFNAENAKSDNYLANITLFYEGKETSIVGRISAEEEGGISIVLIIVAAAILIVIIIAIVFVLFRKYVKKKSKKR